MRVTIVGGGNIGTQFAVHCAAKGNEVVVYTSNPDFFSKHLHIVDQTGKIIYESDIRFATNDPEIAFRNVDLILVKVPSMMMESTAEVIYAHSNEKSKIGVVPGNGGSECAFGKCIDRGNVFFGIERVPAVARLVKKGDTVRAIGYREELHVSSIPIASVELCREIVEGIFDIPCKAVPNFLNLTLTPSNPILHTTRLRTIFGDYKPGVTYDTIPLFYEEWDDASSERLLSCDEEVQDICRALPEFHLEYVKPLRIRYESSSAEDLTRKISGIQAFKGLTTPTVEKMGS